MNYYYRTWKEMLRSSYHTEKSTDTQWGSSYDPSVKTLTFSFQACSSSFDWISVFKVWRKSLKHTELSHLISMHYGIYKKYFSIRDALFKEIETYNPSVIKIRGYSKGAGLALCLHGDLIKNKNIYLNTLTFAPLRVFGIRTPQKYFSEVINLCNGGDLVTFLPPFFLGYKKIGNYYYISGRKFPLPKYHSDKEYEKNLRGLYE
jgi:hypothetical protein